MIVKAPAMKMYIYTYQYDKIKAEGYKSLAALPRDENFSGRLKVHAHSAGTEDPAGIMQYLENTFPGRLRSVCALTETAPSDTFRHPYLNTLVHCADIISVNLEQLLKDGIVEAIYAKDLRRTILDNPDFENIFPVSGIAEIKAAAADDPVDWHLCEKDEYLPYSPWAAIKHYFWYWPTAASRLNTSRWKLTAHRKDSADLIRRILPRSAIPCPARLPSIQIPPLSTQIRPSVYTNVYIKRGADAPLF